MWFYTDRVASRSNETRGRARLDARETSFVGVTSPMFGFYPRRDAWKDEGRGMRESDGVCTHV